MWKKCINIALAVWLINVVTYFHSSNLLQNANQEVYEDEQVSSDDPSTFVGSVVEIFDTDDSPTEGNTHTVKIKRRYVHSRQNNFNYFFSIPTFYTFNAQLKHDVHKNITNYLVGVARLPHYYQFLFRLSPF